MRVNMPSRRRTDTSAVDAERILQLLADSYARQILQRLAESPQSAATLAEQLDCSRATVYRRLNRLEQVGLVTSDLMIDADGHHRRTYATCTEALTVSVCSEGIEAEIQSQF